MKRSVPDAACPLCRADRDTVLWSDARCRVVHTGDADYPGLCRVIWNAHVREMSDLRDAERRHLMAVVFALEQTLREVQHPDKINLASLGNQVPHLHWHVIPRFADDAHFPDPIWAARRRDGARHALDGDAVAAALAQHLGRRASSPS